MPNAESLLSSGKIDVDFLILGDWSEVLGGKLYLQGGGWDTLTVRTGFPHARNVGIALGLVIPWAETNQKYKVSLLVMNDDSQATVVQVEGELETGRPPGLPAGTDQLVMMALNSPVTFDAPATFLISASVNGHERKRKPFRVVDGRPRSSPAS